MSRIRRAAAGVLLGLLCSAATALAQIPGLPAADKAEPENGVRPRPDALAAGFWKYIDDAGDQLTARLNEIGADLAQLADAPARQDSFERYQLNATALPRLKAQEGPQNPPVPELASRYSIADWLKFHDGLRRAELDATDKQTDARILKRSVDAARQRFNNRLAEYLAQAAHDPGHIDLGMELIADRAALATAVERARLAEAAARAAAAHLQSLRGLSAKVDDHLHADAGQVSAAESELINQRAALDAARSRLLRAEAQALSEASDHPVGDADNLLARQRGTEAGAAELAAVLAVAAAETRLALSQSLAGGGESEADTQNLRKESATRLAELERDAHRYQREASSRLASLNPTDGAARKTLQRVLDSVQKALPAIEQARDTLDELGLLAAELDHRRNAASGSAGRLWASTLAALGTVWATLRNWSGETLFTISDTPVTALGLLRVVLIVAIAWWISRLVRNALIRLAEKREAVRASGFYSISRLAHHVILIIGVVVALSSIGLDFTNLAIVAGALSVGIGFGLQSIVNNFVSGLMLLFERSLKVGDFIELADGLAGEVKEINIRSTLINTNDNIDIIVPNSDLMSNRVTNWTLRQAFRRQRIPFGVTYGTDIDKVEAAGLAAAASVPHTLTRGGLTSGVWLVGFGDSSLDFELVVWLKPDAVKRPGTVMAEYRRAIAKALKERDIEIPFPQRDLHVRSLFGRSGDDAAGWYRETLERRAAADRSERETRPEPPEPK